MICKKCEKDCKDKDFYKPDICYRCLFKEKTKLFSKFVRTFKLCKICKGKVPEGKDAYCCDECAHKGKVMKDRSYWFRKCSAPKIKWKT